MRKPLAVLVSLIGLFASAPAAAFCGFYVSGADAKLFNDATEVVLLRDGQRTVLSMQNAYKGPPERFAMVVPVPVVLQKENVKTLKKELFGKLDTLTAPRLVEYWEQDPCAPRVDEEDRAMPASGAAAPRKRAEGAAKDLGVKVEAQFTVGEYEIVILSAKDSSGLDTWLRREKYVIPEGAEPYLRPYVQAGSKFFVARVDVKKVAFGADGRAELSPLRFHYDSADFSLPVRLGLINSAGKQDLVVHVLAQGQRYEPANHPSVTIATNLDVSEDARGSFGAFYAALFDRTLEKHPRAIVTEYSWDASTCDPCPGPTLDASDLMSLGADVAKNEGRGGWVLTRMHARYDRASLGQDIVFRAAPPISGGREVVGPGGALEHGAKSAAVNNFQARYAIRHAWTGPVACKDPQRGIWGGPPGGAPPPIAPAKDLAYAPRGAVQLAAMVESDVPELDLASAAPLAPPVASAEPPGAEAAAYPPPTMIPEPEKKGGCAGCATSGARSENPLAPWLAALAATILTGLRRTSRARTSRSSPRRGTDARGSERSGPPRSARRG